MGGLCGVMGAEQRNGEAGEKDGMLLGKRVWQVGKGDSFYYYFFFYWASGTGRSKSTICRIESRTTPAAYTTSTNIQG
jgi:hypothetical protein